MPAHLDPTDLEAVRAFVGLNQSGSRLHAIGLGRIEIGRDALERLREVVRAAAREGPIVVLGDAVQIRRANVDLKLDVARRLAAVGPVRSVVLGAAGVELHADEDAVEAAAIEAAGAGCLVGVGSGTICDIGKAAAARVGVPYVVVQTANSVNAFSDDMAVLLVNGVKRTTPSRWPHALVVDLEVIADAPVRLNHAGVGELVAMFTAPADWRLASLVGMDPTFDHRVVGLFRDGGDALLEAATGMASGDVRSLRTLVELMTLSGMALGIAGRTAPISGTEHTVSHLLDMAAARSGHRTGLHGAQVGVAALAVAVAWDHLLSRLDPDRLLTLNPPGRDRMRARTEAAFADLDPSGVMAAECWEQYGRKLARWSKLRPGMHDLVRQWVAHRAELRSLLGGPEQVARILRAAGSPATFAELDPPASRETAAWALLNGHLIRDRFTLADLAWFAGLWNEEVVIEAIETAETVANAV